jgi:predicted nucleic acid-binding protein
MSSAAAQVQGLAVVTRNEASFQRCDVAQVNPWAARRWRLARPA